jgi:FkbM family methyltransferase
MKNIFLDCGTNICQGLIQFYNNGIIDNTYEIHTFEPNSEGCRVKERIAKIIEQIPLNITTYDSAVWIEDGYISFNQEYGVSATTGEIDLAGVMSSIDGVGINTPGFKNKMTVPSINFSRFVSELPADSNIICKMDIEGAEFQVLRHMIKEGTITRIKEMYVEFHERYVETESTETEKELVKIISDLGVKIDVWF